MTPDEAREKLAAHWCDMADEALASARAEQQAGRGRFAMNRCYYACFYAATAVLLRQNRKFTKHAAVRDAVHQHLVHAGAIDPLFGQTYNRLFAARQEADYGEFAQVDDSTASEAVESAEAFVREMKRLMGN